MVLDGEISLTVHGLQVDNGNVRAEVFLSKFKTLIDSLKLADKVVNEKQSHHFLIVGLETASAHATVRERVSVHKAVPSSSVNYIQNVVQSVYNGDRNISRFDAAVIKKLEPLVRDLGNRFSHGEISFANDNAVRIDDYLAKQFDKAVRRADGIAEESERYFEGVALETLDGVVREMDARGSLVRGKLVLTVGGKEVDCVFQRSDLQILRDSFDRRARVDAIAHYDGESLLPVRLDVRRISLVQDGAELTKWKGALRRRKNGSTGLD